MPEIFKFTFGISNMFLVRDRGVIVIDTGCDTPEEKYKEAFAQSGIKPEEVKLIVITHGHTDHFAFVAGLKKMTGAPVLCHTLASHALETGENPEFIPRGEKGKEFLVMIEGTFPGASAPVKPDITFEDNFDLAPYGISGKVIHTPGHSFCSTSVMLDSGEAFVGDLLIMSPFTNGPSIPLLSVDDDMLFSSYRRILKSAKMIYGGHGEPRTRKEFLEIMASDYSERARKMAEELDTGQD
jgi:hydroxyacylglutathione hydrolase